MRGVISLDSISIIAIQRESVSAISMAIAFESGAQRKAVMVLPGPDNWRFDSPFQSINQSSFEPFLSVRKAIMSRFGDHAGE